MRELKRRRKYHHQRLILLNNNNNNKKKKKERREYPCMKPKRQERDNNKNLFFQRLFENVYHVLAALVSYMDTLTFLPLKRERDRERERRVLVRILGFRGG